MTKSLNTFFDSHCHFDFSVFDTDRHEVWQNTISNGVKSIFIPGVNVDQWRKAANIVSKLQAQNSTQGFYGVGLHPWWFAEWLNAKSASLDSSLSEFSLQLQNAAQAEACRAIGETGLDLALPRDKTVALDTQLVIVKQHLNAANRLGLPLILHCRKAHNALLQLLDKAPVLAGGILHSFTGSAQLAVEYWRRGFCIGVGGSITYPRANKTREAIKALPNEALVLETDAPDMPLCGRQGERNSPEYLPLVAVALAELRNQPIEEVADYCYQNTCRVFAV
ncbi:TatD family hydrolase [Marinagarivorans cellulosilyticus]|uniref:TatD DNase family protein n=1 Tax=Marinagarivorans cellulosilyticus TaxID=2721545 RepID=A0AAN1WIY5_9GAMM|nr:TatD family hydrolase [Marinagarivorans cellulosilyticus]BCD98429.1 TatD DNase family protein [Marinagarivorans cellulosilyticus]